MRHRGKTYLEIAAEVLTNYGKPLPIETIVKTAIEGGMLRASGRSPESAMRARLSSDLRQQGFRSRFQRVGPNRFALRDWELPEYVAPPFVKSLPSETVVCLPQSAIKALPPVFGATRRISSVRTLLRRRELLSYYPRMNAELRNDLRQLVAYALLRDRHGRILTYRRGHYSSAPSMLRGARCLGFGGHVLREDSESLFGVDDAGVLQAAYREIAEELRGTLPIRLDTVGMILDDSSPEGVRHLGFVIKGELPDSFIEEHSSRERAVNDLQLLTAADAWARFHEFEFWSQLVLRQFVKLPGVDPATIVRPRRRTTDADVIVVTGEIASGKSTFAALLRDNCGFGVVSTRACVAKLLGLPDFAGGDRAHFQQAAASLVSSDGGTQLLVDEIAETARRMTPPLVIDGVRQRRTVELLRQHYPRMVVIFIETARDLALRNYRAAAGRQVNLEEFRDARAHPVEHDVGDLKHEADAYIFNGGAPEEMLSVFQSWWFSYSGAKP